jgi:hypothetical protein
VMELHKAWSRLGRPAPASAWAEPRA